MEIRWFHAKFFYYQRPPISAAVNKYGRTSRLGWGVMKAVHQFANSRARPFNLTGQFLRVRSFIVSYVPCWQAPQSFLLPSSLGYLSWSAKYQYLRRLLEIWTSWIRDLPFLDPFSPSRKALGFCLPKMSTSDAHLFPLGHHAIEAVIASAILTGLAVCLVAIRFYTRCFIINAVQSSDWIVLCSLVNLPRSL